MHHVQAQRFLGKGMLYYSLIYPYLLYCINIWGGAYASHLNPLIILQKRAVGVICIAAYLGHSTPLFCICFIKKTFLVKLLKLVDIYQYNLPIYCLTIIEIPSFTNIMHVVVEIERILSLPLNVYLRLGTRFL